MVDFLGAAKTALAESQAAMQAGRAQEAQELLKDAEDCLGLVGVAEEPEDAPEASAETTEESTAAVVTESDPAPTRQRWRESGEIIGRAGLPTIPLTPQTLAFVREEVRWLENQPVEHFTGRCQVNALQGYNQACRWTTTFGVTLMRQEPSM